MKELLLFCMTLCLLGCFKELDFNLDFEGEKIVVRGAISPQNGVELQVTHTLNPQGTYHFDSLNIFLTNAVINLYENETLLKQIPYSGNDGIYQDNSIDIKTDADYHLTVSAEGYPPVKTKKIRVPIMPLATFELKEQDDNFVRIDIDLTDNRENTHYQLLVNGIYQGDLVELNFDLVGIYEQWEACGLIESRFDGVYINDNCFQNTTIVLPVNVQTDQIIVKTKFGSTLILDSAEKVIVRLRSVTQISYDFFATTDAPEDIDNAFVEPTIISSNVEGGYGYFGAYQEIIYTVM